MKKYLTLMFLLAGCSPKNNPTSAPQDDWNLGIYHATYNQSHLTLYLKKVGLTLSEPPYSPVDSIEGKFLRQEDSAVYSFAGIRDTARLIDTLSYQNGNKFIFSSTYLGILSTFTNGNPLGGSVLIYYVNTAQDSICMTTPILKSIFVK
jgi:hypothetical protein